MDPQLVPDAALQPPLLESDEVTVQLAVDAKRPPKAVASSKRMDSLRASCPAVVTRPSPKQDNVPSYLRSTATFQARSKNGNQQPTVQEEVPKPAPKKKSKRFQNVLAKVFAPTAAFISRVMSKGQQPEEKPNKAALEKILKSPQGQRVTTAAPFSLHQTLRAKDTAPKLSTEESELLEAQKKMFKPHAVPKHVHEHRPSEGLHVVSTPAKPDQIFEPFNLASQGRHATEVAKRATEREAQAKAEEAQRVFRAMPFNKELADKALSPRKPAPKPATVPVAPRLMVEERCKQHEAEVAPARKERMNKAGAQKMEEKVRKTQAEEAQAVEQQLQEEEEKKRQEELEKTAVADLRKSLVFKARPMPEFQSVFRPDLSKALKVTQSLEFKLKVDERLGRSVAAINRHDLAAAQMGPGRYDAEGYADPFVASLRSSVPSKAKEAMSYHMSLSPGAFAGAGGRSARSGAAGSTGPDLSAALDSALHMCRRNAHSHRASPLGAAAPAPVFSNHNSPRMVKA